MQLANLDNELRKERELGIPRKVKLSTLEDRNRLPLSWHFEFWTPGEVSEEEIGFPLVHIGQDRALPKPPTPPLSKKSSRRTSCEVSRRSSKRNSFREPTPLRRIRERNSVSRCSSTKRSRPGSTCLSVKSTDDDRDWEWVWEDEEDEEEELKAIQDDKETGSEATSPNNSVIEQKLEIVKDIIEKPEDKWRFLGVDRIPSPTGSTRSSRSTKSSNVANVGTVQVQVRS